MFFCPNCDNIYSITKNPPVNANTMQHGGKQDSDTPTSVSMSESGTHSDDDIVTMILKTRNYNKTVDIKLVDEIMKSASYKKLSSKDKVFVKNTLMDQLPQEDKIKLAESTVAKTIGGAYFICKNCGTSEQINQGTLVMSKLTTDGSHDFIDNTNYKNMIHVKTLPLTRNYICPNGKCISHKEHDKREAVFFRMGSQYRVRYVCRACQISWI